MLNNTKLVYNQLPKANLVIKLQIINIKVTHFSHLRKTKNPQQLIVGQLQKILEKVKTLSKEQIILKLIPYL